MAIIVVDVMLKPEILDPQGNAVASALPRLGFPLHSRLDRESDLKLLLKGTPHRLK